MTRRASWVTIVAVAAFLVFPSIALAEGRTRHFGPFSSASLDGGSCGNAWANDTFDRTFTVRENKDGSFYVKQEFKNGRFVTIAGPSPGACQTDAHHGSYVDAGITGSFHGNLSGAVTGGSYNPNGCSSNPSACATTGGFISAVFPGGTFKITEYRFHYAAGDQGLIYHQWNEVSRDGSAEVSTGDIATK